MNLNNDNDGDRGPRGIVVSTYLDPDDAEHLRRLAEQADRSTAAEIRRLVRAHLAEQGSRS